MEPTFRWGDTPRFSSSDVRWVSCQRCTPTTLEILDLPGLGTCSAALFRLFGGELLGSKKSKLLLKWWVSWIKFYCWWQRISERESWEMEMFEKKSKMLAEIDQRSKFSVKSWSRQFVKSLSDPITFVFASVIACSIGKWSSLDWCHEFLVQLLIDSFASDTWLHNRKSFSNSTYGAMGNIHTTMF